jgi:hypothetical protein
MQNPRTLVVINDFNSAISTLFTYSHSAVFYHSYQVVIAGHCGAIWDAAVINDFNNVISTQTFHTHSVFCLYFVISRQCILLQVLQRDAGPRPLVVIGDSNNAIIRVCLFQTFSRDFYSNFFAPILSLYFVSFLSGASVAWDLADARLQDTRRRDFNNAITLSTCASQRPATLSVPPAPLTPPAAALSEALIDDLAHRGARQCKSLRKQLRRGGDGQRYVEPEFRVETCRVEIIEGPQGLA